MTWRRPPSLTAVPHSAAQPHSQSFEACESVCLADEASLSVASAREQLVRRLESFELDVPTRQELRALVCVLRQDHAISTCPLVSSLEGLRTIDAVVAWLFEAWRRSELHVLFDAADDAACDEKSGCHGLLFKAGRRRAVPGLAAVAVKGERSPFIELLWVKSDLRRLGVGSCIVRKLCAQQPRIKRVRCVLPEAVSFWDAVGDHVTSF